MIGLRSGPIQCWRSAVRTEPPGGGPCVGNQWDPLFYLIVLSPYRGEKSIDKDN